MEMFYENLKLNRKNLADNVACINERKYKEIIANVLEAKARLSKTPRDYRILKRFDILETNDVQKLIVPLNKDRNEEEIRYYVTDEQLYSILYETHVYLGHAGRDTMMQELKLRYKNITYKDVRTFLEACEECAKGLAMKQKKEKPVTVVKPTVNAEMNSRCQIDLLDYRSQPDGDFQFIMVYQDFLTKFIVLKALKSRTAVEVADNLTDIFTVIGAPNILQSDSESKFSEQIIEYLNMSWPELKIVNGKPKRREEQGSGEREHQDVKKLITKWMKENKTCRWSEGLRFVQLTKNRAEHPAIRRSPYEALFGAPLTVGFTSSILSQKVLNKINNEEDLEDALRSARVEDSDAESSQEDPGEVARATDTVEGDTSVCVVCQEKCSGHTCTSCNNMVHATCCAAKLLKEPNRGLCIFCERRENVSKHRDEAKRIKLAPDSNHLSVNKGILKHLLTSAKTTATATAGTSDGGQEALIQCACKFKCQTKRCICLKLMLPCHSNCHKSLPCNNK